SQQSTHHPSHQHPPPHHPNPNTQHNHGGHFHPHPRQHNPHPKQTGGMTHAPTVGPGISNQYNNQRPPRDKNVPTVHIPPSPHMNPPQTNVPNTAPMTLPHQSAAIPHQMWQQYRYPFQQYYEPYYPPVYPMPYTVPAQRVPMQTPPHVNNSSQIVPPAKNKAIPIINPLSLKENPLPQKSSLPKKDETPPTAITESKQSAEINMDKEKQLNEAKESKAERREREEKEREERERIEKERKEVERQKREREEKERIEREEKERKERIEREEKERKAREEKERKEREERERKEREEKERKEREEKERKEKEEEAERIKKEKEEKERKEREELERKEREERERKEREEAERIKKEQEEKERKEREEAERIKKEQEERERKEREEAERIKKEQEEKEKKEREEKERLELERKKKEEEEAAAAKAAEEAEKQKQAELAEKAEPKKEEKKVTKGRPGPLDLTKATSASAPGSAPLSALGSARIIDDLNTVPYPPNIKSPNPQLNANAEPGKFKYDRTFLMQFMDVCKEKPENLPALDAIGMEESKEDKKRSQQRNIGGSSGGGAGVGGTRTPQHKPAGASQYANMGEFKSPPKTSDERFQQSTINLGMSRSNSSSFGGRPPLSNRSGSNNPLLPNAMLSNNNPPSPGRTPSGRGGGGRQSRKPQHAQPGAPTIPPEQVVPLEQSENRWQPPTIAGGLPKATEDFIPLEVVQRKVKALLNKLTLEKFDSISDQIIDYANKSRNEKDGRILRTVIQLTFLKACDESNFSQMYAQLCRKMMERIDPEIVDENVKSPDGNKYVQGGTLFRKYLLNRCQEDFEKGWKVNIPVPSNEKGEPDLLSDEYYAAQKAKRIGLGLIKFIGELFKLTMLTERIMHECIKKLLSNVSNPEEEETESLCKLLTTVGKQLDHPKAKEHMDVYFNRMKAMSDNPNLSNRIKFMLLDVIELRNNNWVPRRDNNAPKTIAEIHEDAAKQKEEAEFLRRTASSGGRGLPRLDQQLSRPGSGRRDTRDKGTHGGNVPANADGWSTVGSSSSASRKTGDLSKFGSVSRSKVSGLSLAPGGQGSFAGLAGGSKGWKADNRDRDDKSSATNRTSPVPATTSSTNVYSVLAHTENIDGRKSTEGTSTTIDSAKSVASSSTPNPPQERKRLQLLPKGSTQGTTPIKSTDALIKDTTSTSTEKVAETPSLTAEQAGKKIQSMIDEYWSVLDVEEVSKCMKELPPQHLSEAMLSFITDVLEKKQKDVDNVAKVFKDLTSKGIVGKADVKKAFEDVLPTVEDLELDVPHVSDFTGQLLHSAGLEIDETAELISTMDLSNVEPCAAKAMLAYLNALMSEIGEGALENKLKDSSFTIKTIFPKATPEQISKVLDKHCGIDGEKYF
ncbi:4525_t:CDS:10, partial [Ambispora leptoticha]